ncbi:MAG TPA: ATP-binding protein [Spirochaetota bacterium]|nr:ATP-binding protein [Spirochaetota bacterium]HOL57767.1 ATP-binding protein [Spirochaetota bacterium]HPP05426.1 ATP-binding protein [Spirochaetota bacterium]
MFLSKKILEKNNIESKNELYKNRNLFLLISDIISLPIFLYEAIYLSYIRNSFAIFIIIGITLLIISIYLILVKKNIELLITLNIGVLNLVLQFGLLIIISHSKFQVFPKTHYLLFAIFLSAITIIFMAVFSVKFYQYITFTLISFLFSLIFFVLNLKDFLKENIIMISFIVYIIFIIISYFVFKISKKLESLYEEKNILSKEYYNQKEFLKTLFETIPNPIYYKDENLRYAGFNKAFLDYLGKKEEEVIGRTVFDITEKDIAMVYNEKDMELLNSDKNIQIYEYKVKTKEGEKDVVFYKGKFYIDYNPYIVGVITDITELKKAKEEALLASKVKSEFLAKMTHELRNPLNAIMGFTEVLNFTNLDTQQKEYINYIQEASKLLLEMVNDVLDFSKIEAGKMTLKEEIIEFKRLLENTVDIIKIMAEKKSLRFIKNFQPDLPAYIEVDQLRLKQVLLNLLSNAIKFTEKGEVELSVKFKESYNKEDGFFTFSVRDTGIGIKEEDKNKLFKAFTQVDNTLTRKFGGTGLGLVISNFIVEKMGGNIQFESEYNKGSNFYFTIKLKYRN